MSPAAHQPEPAGAPQALLLTRTRYPGSQQLVDLLIRNGRISAIRPAGEFTDRHQLQRLDAGGRTVLPGLWDHHVHFTQWVIQQQRIDLAGAATAEQTLQLVSAAAAEHSGNQRLTGFGFRDGLWPNPPTLEALDAVTGEVPTVLVSADLHSMWINSPAQRQFGAQTDTSGLLRETEAFAVLQKLEAAADLSTDDYRRAAHAAASRGVVGVVDFENDDNAGLWPQRIASGVDSLRVEVSVWPDKLTGAIEQGLRTGDVLDERGLVTMGPLKVIVDGSLNTRTAWCWEPYPGFEASDPHRCGVEAVPIDQLSELMRTAGDAGIQAAIHAIGDRANTEVLDTFERLGMRGRVEHAQLLRACDIPRFTALGLEASVQPEHAMDDRDVAETHWPQRTAGAFALRSLHESGAGLRLGSDAPVSALDPWVQIAAAVTRSRDGRSSWHPEQTIEAATAVAASTRTGVQASPGDPADLVLVDLDPLTASGEQLRTMPVAATMLAGRLTHSAL